MLQLFTTVLLLGFATVPQAPAQEQTRRKPVLIRDERAGPVPEVFEHNPAKAREYVEIGDFYNKRKKFEAAESRYRDAIRYDQTWHESYNKLIKLLEKQKRIDEALEVCNGFIESNPDSKKLKDFTKKAASLTAKLAG